MIQLSCCLSEWNLPWAFFVSRLLMISGFFFFFFFNWIFNLNLKSRLLVKVDLLAFYNGRELRFIPVFLQENVRYVPQKISGLLHAEHRATQLSLNWYSALKVSCRTPINLLLQLLLGGCSWVRPDVQNFCSFRFKNFSDSLLGLELFLFAFYDHLHFLGKHFVGQLEALVALKLRIHGLALHARVVPIDPVEHVLFWKLKPVKLSNLGRRLHLRKILLLKAKIVLSKKLEQLQVLPKLLLLIKQI